MSESEADRQLLEELACEERLLLKVTGWVPMSTPLGEGFGEEDEGESKEERL